MEAEMDATLGYEKNQKGKSETENKRNGYSTKTAKSQYGELPIEIPRDRNVEFEPKLMLLDDKITKEAYDGKYDDITRKIKQEQEERRQVNRKPMAPLLLKIGLKSSKIEKK